MSVVQFVRGKVSKSKRRYIDKKHGFDLDLSYIVEKRIIAMGFPSEGMEANYRNPYSEVIRFLHIEHKDHYKIYNLCSERGYDPIKFQNRVGHYPFDDHNAPPFELIDQFCEDVKKFLSEDERNVAVIHCKAGKGRTGTMICSYMLYEKLWSTTQEAMTFYAAMRTYNCKGVTIPSQIRYIEYYEHFLKYGMPPIRTLLLKQIILHGIPKVSGVIEFNVIIGKTIIHHQEGKIEKALLKKKKKESQNAVEHLDCVNFVCQSNVPLHGDVKVEIFTEKQALFHVWFNTAFVACQWQAGGKFVQIFQQNELDKANKDKHHKIFPPGFCCEFVFDMLDNSEIADLENVYLKHTENQLKHKNDDSVTKHARYSNIVYTFPSLNNY